MISIDGSFGEGGGQILRTSLALSLVTGKPFRIERIRSRRHRPGLMRQHLTAANAAAAIGQAAVTGNNLGSQTLTFAPNTVRPGSYRFDVGTAGSCTLVLQTVLPALMTAASGSEVVLDGGTHNPHAPPFDFLARSFLPVVGAMGPKAVAHLERAGFYPAGGGRVRVSVTPAERLLPVELLERGKVVRRSARALVSNLPASIGEREMRVVRRRLSLSDDCISVEAAASPGPGNAVVIEIKSEHVTEVFTEFGQKGVAAEVVARDAADQAASYLDAGVPVGTHLADQLLVPMALAGCGAFRTSPLTDHAKTNIEVLKQFLDVRITASQVAGDVWEIAVRG